MESSLVDEIFWYVSEKVLKSWKTAGDASWISLDGFEVNDLMIDDLES